MAEIGPKISQKFWAPTQKNKIRKAWDWYLDRRKWTTIRHTDIISQCMFHNISVFFLRIFRHLCLTVFLRIFTIFDACLLCFTHFYYVLCIFTFFNYFVMHFYELLLCLTHFYYVVRIFTIFYYFLRIFTSFDAFLRLLTHFLY